jgi:hypothetical protein
VNIFKPSVIVLSVVQLSVIMLSAEGPRKVWKVRVKVDFITWQMG